MRFSSTCLRGIVLALGIAVVSSCSRQAAELPAPAAAAGVSISEAQAWYQATYSPSTNSPEQPAAGNVITTDPTLDTPATLNWNRALTVGTGAQQLVLVPLAGNSALLANTPYAGPRYLIVAKTATNVLDGNLVEVLLRRTTAPVDTVALFSSLYRSYRNGQLAAPATGEGYVLLYSASYQYLTGRQFRQGQLLPGAARLGFQPAPGTTSAQRTSTPPAGGAANIAPPSTDPCIDWFNASTGDWIARTGTCNVGGDPAGVYTGGGPCSGSCGGPGGYGGGGGSSGTGASGPVSTLTINMVALKPCETQVMQKLQTTSGTALLGIVKLFSSTNPTSKYNWTVKDGILPTGTYGTTTAGYDLKTNTVTSMFDAHQWQNASDLALARTMLHEAVHAYLTVYFATDPIKAKLSYPELAAAYLATYISGTQADYNNLHHTEMTRPGDPSWLGDIAWSLKQYGLSQGYKLTDQFYMDMAWGGLENTTAYDKLSYADQLRIHNTLVIEATGNDAQGNIQKQSGKSAGCK